MAITVAPAPAAASGAALQQSSTATATYEVTGMSCVSCVAALEGGLLKQSGVTAATANFLTGSLTVTFDQGLTSAEAVAKAADDLGYPARLLQLQQQTRKGSGAAAAAAAAVAGDAAAGEVWDASDAVGRQETLQLTVGGMSCASCVGSVEEAVRKVNHLIMLVAAAPQHRQRGSLRPLTYQPLVTWIAAGLLHE
jgi:copper chaperone CopZ